ncbi:MAG TPA: hypothetical protein PLW77_03035 [Bacteroidales bacterium]|nr:hypothetical protein [Bacteroidales bacterium]HQB20930.1 hypothetical protein [Bacteroidales bacterium]
MKIIKTYKRNLADCLVIVAALIVLGIIFENIYFYYIAGGIALLCGLIPKIAFYISFLWQSIGLILGFFVSKILLTIIFYFIVFPFSLLQKLFSKNPSISKKTLETYWKTRTNTSIDFEKLW